MITFITGILVYFIKVVRRPLLTFVVRRRALYVIRHVDFIYRPRARSKTLKTPNVYSMCSKPAINALAYPEGPHDLFFLGLSYSGSYDRSEIYLDKSKSSERPLTCCIGGWHH